MRKHRSTKHNASAGHDAWRSAMMIWETSIAAPQVIAQRMARFSQAALAPSVSDQAEFMRMWQEKYAAFGESTLEIAYNNIQLNQIVITDSMRQWLKFWTNPFPPPVIKPSTQLSKLTASTTKKALAPIHRRATANAKRLSRGKRR